MITTKITTDSGIMSSDVFSDEFARRRIYLTDEVNAKSASEICAQINHLASESNEDIYLIIQSPGGVVSAGMAILDTMNGCGCNICTVVSGEADSIAAVLASSGTKGRRFIGKSAEMLIHQPLGGASGQASDIQRTATHILNVKRKLNMILSKNTGQTYEKICEDCERDTYLSAEEAIEYGLVDKFFEGFD